MSTIIGTWANELQLEDNDSDIAMTVQADVSGASVEIRDGDLRHRMLLDDAGRVALIRALSGPVD